MGKHDQESAAAEGARRADAVGQSGRDRMSCPVDEQDASRAAAPLVLAQGVPPCCFHTEFPYSRGRNLPPPRCTP